MTWQDPDPDGLVAGRGQGRTGHQEVDAVIAGLVDLPATPLHEQVARFADAHRSLQQTLRTIDET